jgi:hypothetical protein
MRIFTTLLLLATVATTGCTPEVAPVDTLGVDTLHTHDTVSSETVSPPDAALADTGLSDAGPTDTETPPDDLSAPDATLVDADPCLTDEAYFEEHLWGPTLSTKCFVCHNPEGIAKQSNFVLIEENEPGALKSNFNTTKNLALEEFAGGSVLLLKPTNTHPMGHTGGKQFEMNSGEHLIFTHFVERMLGTADGCDADTPDDVLDCSNIDPGPRQLRRLSHFEYDNTIFDLFGFASAWGKNFTVDTFHHGFDNHGPSLSVSPLLAEQYRKAAEQIAEKAMQNKEAILPCTPFGGQESQCAAEFIEVFGARVFRRPLTNTDIARYEAIYDLGSSDGFDTGIFWTLAAMLQSPHFLYRPELGEHVGEGLFQLTTYEVASQLSYFLWATMPDPELMAAAADGTLLQDEVLLAQTTRLIADPRRMQSIRHFALQWLDINKLGIASKDAALFPEFTEEVRSSMLEETARFFDHVMFEATGSLTELFGAQYSLLNAALADFYGIGAAALGAAHEVVDLKDAPYGGILTQGSILAAHAFPNSGSPIHRGVMIRERLLCQELPPPPPGVIVQVPAIDPELTTRERFMAHSEVEPCFGCHQLIDPIGFAFENYDAIGRFRDNEAGIPIDATGELVGTLDGDIPFDGVQELSTLLGESPQVHDCFARQVLRFAYGFGEEDGLSCLVRKVEDDFKESELNMASLFTDLTRTVHFTTRVGEAPDPVIVDESDTGEVIEDTVSPEDTTDEDAGPSPNLVDIEMVIQSEWQAGYCADVFVTNTSGEKIVWSFVMPIEGEITTIWNATATDADGGLQFVGVDWNKELGPDGTTSFGFCAAK